MLKRPFAPVVTCTQQETDNSQVRPLFARQGQPVAIGSVSNGRFGRPAPPTEVQASVRGT